MVLRKPADKPPEIKNFWLSNSYELKIFEKGFQKQQASFREFDSPPVLMSYIHEIKRAYESMRIVKTPALEVYPKENRLELGLKITRLENECTPPEKQKKFMGFLKNELNGYIGQKNFNTKMDIKVNKPKEFFIGSQTTKFSLKIFYKEEELFMIEDRIHEMTCAYVTYRLNSVYIAKINQFRYSENSLEAMRCLLNHPKIKKWVKEFPQAYKRCK